jgi:hypothetical protein
LLLIVNIAYWVHCLTSARDIKLLKWANFSLFTPTLNPS